MRECVVLYDAACGRCVRFKGALEFFDVHRRLDFVSLKQANEEGMLDDVPPPLRFRSFHLVLPGGKIRSGAAALQHLLDLFPAGKVWAKLISLAPFGSGLLGFVYSVASRQHEGGSCGLQIGSNNAKPSSVPWPDSG